MGLRLLTEALLAWLRDKSPEYSVKIKTNFEIRTRQVAVNCHLPVD